MQLFSGDATKTAQTEELIFQNVVYYFAYRATVYRTGVKSELYFGWPPYNSNLEQSLLAATKQHNEHNTTQ